MSDPAGVEVIEVVCVSFEARQQAQGVAHG